MASGRGGPTDPDGELEGRQHPLPANPNCVAFAAEAARVLSSRGWAEVQRLAARTAGRFHRASGLAVLAGLGWRVALDRRNRRRTEVVLYFTFDGPATSAHIDALEEAVASEPIRFGAGSIERVPTHGVPTILCADGQAHVLWSRDHDRTCWLRKLVLDENGVRAVRIVESEADVHDVAAEFPGALGVPAPFGDAEREVERMRLAFALHFSRRIIEADGVVQDAEAEFMANVFPAELIDRLGLTDERVQREYLEASRDGLQGRIGHHDRLGLIGLFFSTCYSDGSLDAREMRVLKDAGEWLGLTREEVVKYLRRFW